MALKQTIEGVSLSSGPASAPGVSVVNCPCYLLGLLLLWLATLLQSPALTSTKLWAPSRLIVNIQHLLARLTQAGTRGPTALLCAIPGLATVGQAHCSDLIFALSQNQRYEDGGAYLSAAPIASCRSATRLNLNCRREKVQ